MSLDQIIFYVCKEHIEKRYLLYTFLLQDLIFCLSMILFYFYLKICMTAIIFYIIEL